MKKPYIPTDNDMLEAITALLYRDWDGNYSAHTWNIKLRIQAKHPSKAINTDRLRKHLRGMSDRGLIKYENACGNSIKWTLVIPEEMKHGS